MNVNANPSPTRPARDLSALAPSDLEPAEIGPWLEARFDRARENLHSIPRFPEVLAQAVHESWRRQTAPLRGSFFRAGPTLDEARKVVREHGFADYITGTMDVRDLDVRGALSVADPSGRAGAIFLDAKRDILACLARLDPAKPEYADRLLAPEPRRPGIF